MNPLTRTNLILLPFLVAFAAADFHIFNCIYSDEVYQSLVFGSVAVPSNEYGCDPSHFIDVHGAEGNSVWTNTATWDVQNICNEPQVDAYLVPVNGTFNLFRANGDGSVIGTCNLMFPIGEVSGCEGRSCIDMWVCYSPVVCGY